MSDAEGACQVEELGHTSEVGLRIRAKDSATAFGCAGEAMFQLLDVEAREATSQKQVVIDALDVESLLVDWLSELLYLYETTHSIVIDCQIMEWTATHLEATITLAKPARSPSTHIKAVTYHQLRVQEADGCLIQVYFDI